MECPLCALACMLTSVRFALQTSAQQRDMVRKVFLNGKAREGREFQMFQRNLKKSGATEPGAIASQLQSSLEASASAHKRLSAMLDSAKKVGTYICPLRARPGASGYSMPPSCKLMHCCLSGQLMVLLWIVTMDIQCYWCADLGIVI